MKIRAGFVSNSSSSSFIIAFPDGVDPTMKSDEELAKIIYGNAKSSSISNAVHIRRNLSSSPENFSWVYENLSGDVKDKIAEINEIQEEMWNAAWEYDNTRENEYSDLSDKLECIKGELVKRGYQELMGTKEIYYASFEDCGVDAHFERGDGLGNLKFHRFRQ
jgi:hypothetical protein